MFIYNYFYKKNINNNINEKLVSNDNTSLIKRYYGWK